MEEYLSGIAERYNSLSPDQKMALVEFIDTEIGQLVSFILGPEMSGPIEAIKRDQAAPVEQLPAEPMIEELPPRRPGLGQRV